MQISVLGQNTGLKQFLQYKMRLTKIGYFQFISQHRVNFSSIKQKFAVIYYNKLLFMICLLCSVYKLLAFS